MPNQVTCHKDVWGNVSVAPQILILNTNWYQILRTQFQSKT